MSVTIRPYRKGGWEVDITTRLPDGSRYRERTKAQVCSLRLAPAWATWPTPYALPSSASKLQTITRRRLG